ncbi:hypothetical protein FFLO_05069 [Filobasidium floriforme]|uniref:Phosphoglycerate mutase n=2 Tax=Filobasidium floriforme TaxID=5210 RepID=A0A8K0JHP9_9TREE|nr:hypothetical protein FFLO_05069 [Filobasidium floriforme]
MKRTADLVVPGKLPSTGPYVIDPSNVAHIYVSPRQRAQKTAELTTEEIAEWDYGAYEGLITKEIKEKKKDWWIWTDGCPPSEKEGGPAGESPEEMEKRVDGFIAKIRARHRECYEKGEDAKDIVVVSHGHFSRCFIVRWCGWPLETGYHISADAGALSILGYQHHNLDEPSLIALNWFSADRA